MFSTDRCISQDKASAVVFDRSAYLIGGNLALAAPMSAGLVVALGRGVGVCLVLEPSLCQPLALAA